MENQKASMDEIVQSAAWKKFMEKMDVYSAVLTGILVAMIIVGYTGNRNFRLIAIITLLTLATTSFFMAYLTFDSESKVLSKWFYKVYGIGLSLGFVNILFIIQHFKFPFGTVVTPFVILLMSISFYLGLREVSGENRNKLNWIFFLRLSLGLIPLIYLFIKK